MSGLTPVLAVMVAVLGACGDADGPQPDPGSPLLSYERSGAFAGQYESVRIEQDEIVPLGNLRAGA